MFYGDKLKGNSILSHLYINFTFELFGIIYSKSLIDLNLIQLIFIWYFIRIKGSARFVLKINNLGQ